MRPPELPVDVLAPGDKTVVWQLPEEIPVAFIYNGLTYAIMLCTPQDIEDFARGFSVTERIIDIQSDWLNLEISTRAEGVEVRISIEQNHFDALKLLMSRRNLPGRSCGVCGLDSETEFFETLKPVAQNALLLNTGTIVYALEQFETLQKLKLSNKSVHGAAWVEFSGDQPYGKVDLVREDVGRHNALDKLVGALIYAKRDISLGFLMISSRCSYDILLKAARSGIRAIVSLSAPTAFALRKAKEANISLYTLTKSGIFRVYP